MGNHKITNIEIIFLSVIVMVSHIILDLPNVILTSTASSAPLNVIYITILALVFFIIISKFLTPFHNKDILEVSEYVGGSILKKVMSILFSLHLVFISGILILSFVDTIKTIYLQDMPTPLISLIFILVAVIANLFSFKSVSKTNAVLIPFILFSTLLIFITLIGDLTPQRVFPILGYGFNETFVTGANNIFAFGELILLLLLTPSLKSPKDSKKVGIIAIVVAGFFLLLTVTCLLLLFPFSTGNEGVLSIYMITRSIQFCKFFQRTDALFILIWVLTFFCYSSVVLSYIFKITKKSKPNTKTSSTIYIIAIAIFIVTLLPQNIAHIRFAENVIYKYASLIIVFGFSFIISLLGYLKKRKEKGLVEINIDQSAERSLSENES